MPFGPSITLLPSEWWSRPQRFAFHGKTAIMRALGFRPETAMVAQFGPPATTRREPRQARKGATVVVKLGAGVWLGWVISIVCMIECLHDRVSA